MIDFAPNKQYNKHMINEETNRDSMIESVGVVIGNILAAIVGIGFYGAVLLVFWKYVAVDVFPVSEMNYYQAVVTTSMLMVLRFAMNKK